MRADPACHVAEHRSTDWALECARTWQCGVCMPPSAAAVKGGLVVRRSDVDPVDGDQDRSPLANSADLTDVETDRLDELEHVVARGLQTFVEVGQALGEIRDRRLYRATHGTFDNYCRERWGFVASRARQLIAAAETVTAVTAAGLPAPSTEAVTREMAPLRSEPERLREVWAEAVDGADGAPTAKQVSEAVRRPSATDAQWSEDERRMRELLEQGISVVVNLRTHRALIQWAGACGRLVRIDRQSDWGNPFEMPGDGDRHVVVAAHRDHYLPHKASLLERLGELRGGKALACWCAPAPCHGDVLAKLANESDQERLSKVRPDFAERIREGTATLEYAESVTVETGVRIESWAEKLREALRMLGPMAGHPFPPELAKRLTVTELQTILMVLDLLAELGFGRAEARARASDPEPSGEAPAIEGQLTIDDEDARL